MDIIELAREIGRQLQQDERYKKMHEISEICDKDESLQKMIGEFNLKRMNLNHVMEETPEDRDKIQRLNAELRGSYNLIMQNPHMTSYNDAKKDMDGLLQRVSAIINQSAEGEDPDTADYVEASSGCGGGCSSCSGCH